MTTSAPRLESMAASKAGLARLRPLSIQPIPKASDTQATLPDGWYFNETKENEFWDDIEKTSDDMKTDMQRNLQKQTEQVTDLQDTSNKIRSLVNQFDDIDQDTLMNLMQLYDDGIGAEALDQHMIMNDSKTHVLDFMTQLKDLSNSQTSLMETLRFWFSTLQQHSRGGDVGVELEELPTVDDVYIQLGQMVKDYTEKSEHAACLHNDITDFWFKQIANYKRIVLMRDEEIRKLQQTISDASAAAQARRAKKKNEEKSINDLNVQREQMEQQLRLNQEQKQQIEQLKKALQENEVQRAALSSMGGGGSDKLQNELYEKEADMNTLKIEFESRIASQTNIIQKLQDEIEMLKKNLKDEEQKNMSLQEKIKQLSNERDELEASLKKQLQMAALEKQKGMGPVKVDSGPMDRSEMYELQMKHQDEIRSLQNKHREEMTQQAEMSRQKYLKERERLLQSLESNDNNALLQSIAQECERKIESMKEDFGNHENGLIKEWAAKQALLTRQYENRIKSINSAHEVDLIMARDSVKYEVKKAELDLEEKYHLQILQLGRERQEKYDDFQKHLDRLTDELSMKDKEIERLNSAIAEANIQLQANSLVTDVMDELDKKEEEERQTSRLQKTHSSVRSEKLLQTDIERIQEKYAMKIKVMKEELDEQMNWALNKQKLFYEREMNKMVMEHQKEMRERLMNLQDVITQMKENENPEAVENVMSEITDAFESMNSQIQKIEDEPSVPTMTVQEAAERTKVLTERLIQLRNENQDLRQSAVFVDTTEEEKAQLQERIKLLEAIQNNDASKALEQYNQMENHYKEELAVKDQLLNNMQRLNNVFKNVGVNKMKHFGSIISIEPCEIPARTFIPKEAPPRTIPHVNKTQMNTSPLPNQNARYELTEPTVVISAPPKRMPAPLKIKERKPAKPPPPPEPKNDKDKYLNNIADEAKENAPHSSRESTPKENVRPAKIKKKPKTCREDNNVKKSRPLPTVEEGIQVGTKVSITNSKPYTIEQFRTNEDMFANIQQTKSNLQELIENSVVPHYDNDEKPMVKQVIGEVFDELPKHVVEKPIESVTSLNLEISEPAEYSKAEIRAVISLDKISLDVDVGEKKSTLTSSLIDDGTSPAITKTPTPALTPELNPDVEPPELVLEPSQQVEEDSKKPRLFATHSALIIPTNTIIEIPPPSQEIINIDISKVMEIYEVPFFITSLHESPPIINERQEPLITKVENAPVKEIKLPTPAISADGRELNLVMQFMGSLSLEEEIKKLSKYNSPPVIYEVIPDGKAEDQDKLISELQSQIVSLKEKISDIENEVPDSKVVVVKDVELDPLKKRNVPKVAMAFTEEQIKEMNKKKEQETKRAYQRLPVGIVSEEHEREELSNITEENSGRQHVQFNFDSKGERSLHNSSRDDGGQDGGQNGEQPIDPEELEDGYASSRKLHMEVEPNLHVSLTKELSNSDFTNPFSSAKQLVQTMSRTMKDFTSSDIEIMNVMGNNISAYDAYINAAGLTDEAHFSFVDRLKQTKRSLDDQLDNANQVNFACEKLMKYINAMTNQFNKTNQMLNEMKRKEAAEQLEMNQELISSIAQSNVDPSLPPQMAQLDTIHKIQDSLGIMDQLGLLDNPHHEDERISIEQEIKQIENNLKENVEVPQAKIDDLVTRTQTFIGQIRVPSPRPSSPTAENEETHTKEQMLSDLKRIRKQRDKLNRDLKIEKVKGETMKEQVVNLNNRIQEQKEQAANDITSYKAQISSLRQALHAISGEDENGSTNPDAVASSVKRQILNLQALLETTEAERDMFKAKAADAEDSLIQSEETISHLNHQIEQIMLDPPTDKPSTMASNMFHDADMEQLKEERAADEVKNRQHVEQLEKAVAQNTLLTQRSNDLEQKLIRTRQELRQAQDTIDEMMLKNAVGAKLAPKITTFDKAVQFTPKIVPKPKVETKVKEEKTNQHDDNLLNNLTMMQIQKSSPHKTNTVKEVIEEKPKEDLPSRPSSARNENPIPLATVHTANDSKASFKRPFSSSANFDLDDNDEETDAFSSELTKLNEEGDSNKFSDDDKMIQIHQPLDFLKKKKVKIPVVGPKTNRSQTVRRPMRHVTSTTAKAPATTDSIELSINNAQQGRRQLTGTIGPIKPTKKRNPDDDPSTVTIPNQPEPPEKHIPVIQSSLALPQLESDNRIPASMLDSVQRPLENVPQTASTFPIEKSLEANPPVPMRITLVVHDQPQIPKDRPLMIITQPSQQSNHVSPLNGIRGYGMKKIQDPPHLTEIQKLVNKLREQIRNLQEQNEKKDIEIVNQRQKISELTLIIHRLKLDNIKHQDDLKRSQIRYENIKSRLDICFNEIGIRDDEIAKLKRELMILRSKAQPVNETLTRIKNAQREKERLEREKERRKAVAQVTQNALKNVTNDDVKKHLSGLLEHEQVSIARLEAKRRMWTEIERKHMMGVLSAMSLLSDSQYDTVKKVVLPSYSPFNTSKVSTFKTLLMMNQRNDSIAEFRIPTRPQLRIG